jgi:hypothetical protein
METGKKRELESKKIKLLLECAGEKRKKLAAVNK